MVEPINVERWVCPLALAAVFLPIIGQSHPSFKLPLLLALRAIAGLWIAMTLTGGVSYLCGLRPQGTAARRYAEHVSAYLDEQEPPIWVVTASGLIKFDELQEYYLVRFQPVRAQPLVIPMLQKLPGGPSVLYASPGALLLLGEHPPAEPLDMGDGRMFYKIPIKERPASARTAQRRVSIQRVNPGSSAGDSQGSLVMSVLVLEDSWMDVQVFSQEKGDTPVLEIRHLWLPLGLKVYSIDKEVRTHSIAPGKYELRITVQGAKATKAPPIV